MSASSSEGPFGASFLAVKRCCEAWNRTITLSKEKGKKDWEAIEAAAKAYRHAMPFLTSEANIRGFIAAVAEGMILGAFQDKEGARLVYVAQVALTGLSRSSQPEVRPGKDSPSPEPPQANDIQPQSGSAPAAQDLPSTPAPDPAEPTEPNQGNPTGHHPHHPGQRRTGACKRRVGRENTHPPTPTPFPKWNKKANHQRKSAKRK